ncbi:gfo/Idh/MocA family oxidoreductase [Arthrobacter frigidicola]|nr:gfo/Idh/MocA family oxidoreductase [Arthrobacter frigidicola]
MEPIRVGLIGASAANPGWGTFAHLPAIQGLSDYRLTAVSTSRADTAKAAGEAYGVPGFGSASELIQHPDVDLVVVAVKVAYHREIILEALAAGKMVYSEWPLGVNLAEATELAEAATAAGVRTIIGLQGRFAPEVQYLRDLIADGYVGEVLSSSLQGTSVSWAETTTSAQSYLFSEENGATPLTVTTLNALDITAAVLGEPTDLETRLTRYSRPVRVTDTGEDLTGSTPRHVSIRGRVGEAPISIEYRGGTTRGEGLRWVITGTEGELVLSSPTFNGNMQATELELHGGRGDDQTMNRLPVPAKYTSPEVAGIPGVAGNVARMYEAFAGDLRTGTTNSLDFSYALERHQLIQDISEESQKH